MKVRFSMVSEFIAELETDTDLIEDKMLRVTVLYQPLRGLPVVQLFVVAGCVMRGKIVELRQDCGQMLTPFPGVEREEVHVQERLAERLHATLKKEAERLGLTLRAGVLED